MPPPRSSKPRPCSTMSAFAASCSSSPPVSASRTSRSEPTSFEGSSSAPPAPAGDPLAQSLGVEAQQPVVVPRRPCDRQRQQRLDVHAGRPNRMLLRIAPAIPCPFHGRVDELHPRLVVHAGRRRQRQHLPFPVLAHQGHDRLTAWTAVVPEGPRVF